MAKYRRTLDFLSRGKLYLKHSVKVITISFNVVEPSSAGLRLFLKENVPQIQYKNPSIQILALKNTKRTPQINVYHNDDSTTLIDCEFKKNTRILNELTALAGKLDLQVKRDQVDKSLNPANFGNERTGQFCACRIPGQVPCPSIIPILNVEHPWKNKKELSD